MNKYRNIFIVTTTPNRLVPRRNKILTIAVVDAPGPVEAKAIVAREFDLMMWDLQAQYYDDPRVRFAPALASTSMIDDYRGHLKGGRTPVIPA